MKPMSAAQAAQQDNRDGGGRYAEKAQADPGTTVLDPDDDLNARAPLDCTSYPDGSTRYRAAADMELHNTEGPAIVDADGDEHYWLYGEPLGSREAWQAALDSEEMVSLRECEDRGLHVVAHYRGLAGLGLDEPETALKDLLTDVAHVCHRLGLDYNDLAITADDRAHEERTQIAQFGGQL